MTITTILHHDDKFKNVLSSIRLWIPFVQRDNTKLALLAQLMDDRNEKYPTKLSILQKCDNLYGADLRVRTMGYGTHQSLEIRLSAISEKYVTQPIQDEQIQFLSDILYYPLITNETLTEAKRELSDKLRRNDEKPHAYALRSAFELAGENQPLALSSNGRLDEIASITLEEMKQFHQLMIQQAPTALFVVGAIPKFMKDTITDTFKNHQKLLASDFHYSLIQENKGTVIETKPVNQASLIKVYQTQTTIQSANYHAYRIGNAILGQLPTSFLFQEVREKHSLCYSISSSTIGFDGVLYMSTQLATANIDKANELMDQQLEKIKNGAFDDQMLEGAKKMFRTIVLSLFEDEYALLNQLVLMTLQNKTLNKETLLTQYEQVTRQDIVDAFQSVEPILNFQLQGVNQ